MSSTKTSLQYYSKLDFYFVYKQNVYGVEHNFINVLNVKNDKITIKSSKITNMYYQLFVFSRKNSISYFATIEMFNY